jgi:hypothetical protein
MIVNAHRVSALALEDPPPSPEFQTRRSDHAALQGAARELLKAVGADVASPPFDDPRTRQEFMALTTRTSHDQ